MALISGSIKCKNCGKEIKWCYLRGQCLSTTKNLTVETIPNGTMMLNVNPHDRKVEVHCRNCDCLNDIDETETK